MVTTALREAGHPDPQAWEARLPAGQYTTAPTWGHQIFLINRAWRLMIGEVQRQDATQDTTNVRYCLVDNARSVEDWFAAFSQGVIPCAVKHTLPLSPTKS
jgi:hypothetical protein